MEGRYHVYQCISFPTSLVYLSICAALILTCCSLIEHDISYILFRASIILSVHNHHASSPLVFLQNYTKTVVNIHNGNVHKVLFYYFGTFKHCVKTITPIDIVLCLILKLISICYDITSTKLPVTWAISPNSSGLKFYKTSAFKS